VSKQLAILGGGQLAQMIAQAAKPLGITSRCLDPNTNACAQSQASLTNASFTDHQAIAEWADGADSVTCEWENVPLETLEHLCGSNAVYPAPKSFKTGSDRLLEKELFQSVGIGVPEYQRVDDAASLKAAISDIGVPGVLKRRSGGYDGRGQVFIDNPTEALDAWTALGHAPCIYEQRIPFSRELSVVAVRSATGKTDAYPVVENHHANGILVRTLSPAPDLDPELAQDITERVKQMMTTLGHVGVFAVEFFQTEIDGKAALLGNETAPRVHNSGHWTQQGAHTCQFENHARAVLAGPDLDISPCTQAHPTVMLNIIGDEPDPSRLADDEAFTLHLYGKAPRAGRKLGHLNITAPTLEQAIARADEIADLIRPA